MITLYTPATGFPDLEIKIAYGLARVGIEAYGVDRVKIIPEKGFYIVSIEGQMAKLNKTFNTMARRILMSDYLPRNTPGITGRSATTLKVRESEKFDIDIYTKIGIYAEHKESEKFCRHQAKEKVSNVLGFTASATTGVLCKRDGIDISYYQGEPRRPTNPREICKTCALLSLLGMWYASFIFNVAQREVIVIPIPESEVSGSRLQEVFSIQHQIRKEWFNQELPQVFFPLIFLSKIPSSSDILESFDLFIAVLSRQKGYHVDGIYLIQIENYLDFIRQTPYNIAVIDKMLDTFKNRKYTKEAYDALIELNNAIYYHKPDSILKFARLYTLETTLKDSNRRLNLLYPETTKYLLKEIAMINQDFIENPAIGSLARTLRYFIKEKKYSYADDIRNARKEARDFEETIAKMLREGELRRVQQEQNKKQGKKIENWISLPDEQEIKEVFRFANQNFEAVKTALVILAFSFPVKAEETVKTIEDIQDAE